MVEISLRGAVLGYTGGKGREGRGREGRRDLEVFRALERGCEGGAYMGGCVGGSPRGRSLLVWFRTIKTCPRGQPDQKFLNWE